MKMLSSCQFWTQSERVSKVAYFQSKTTYYNYETVVFVCYLLYGMSISDVVCIQAGGRDCGVKVWLAYITFV